MKMKRILTIGIMTLLMGLILTKSINAVVLTSKPQLIKQSFGVSILNIKIKEEIFNEIKATKNRHLVIDKIIGDRIVKYWEHIVDNIFVINDSMLLHMDLENIRVFEYQRNWDNVQVNSLSFGNSEFEGCYFWKRKVVFPDKDDCGLFYIFHDKQEYPLFCWEVRYTDGNTIFYDVNKTPIGYGVSAPSTSGFVVQGYGDSKWRYWRENAQEWYKRWYSSVNCISNANISQISYYIKNNFTYAKIFYVIAHSGGLPSRFLVNKNTYYTTDQLSNDMENRSPMKLAVLCCCSAMNNIGPGTLSYGFRKGEMTNTVTIGYVDMERCPNWVQSLDWQDFMFEKIDGGYTIKKAFNRACAQYPKIADYVKFVGDPNLKINDNKSSISHHSSFNSFINLLVELFSNAFIILRFLPWLQ